MARQPIGAVQLFAVLVAEGAGVRGEVGADEEAPAERAMAIGRAVPGQVVPDPVRRAIRAARFAHARMFALAWQRPASGC